uniref:Uncharacterized protein n=1 Tax=Tanacetum cinerariifolium TaxID=118510 RepID=A0A699T4R4_TANCI|nr:hypothetical protein [Tanacetum cinerariifolium]
MRLTSHNRVVLVQVKELVLNQGFWMYHLMILRKNFRGDEVREKGGKSEEEKETSEDEEVSFDPIPRTPEESKKESDDDEEQKSRLREEARIQEEEDAKELYRDVNIN